MSDNVVTAVVGGLHQLSGSFRNVLGTIEAEEPQPDQEAALVDAIVAVTAGHIPPSKQTSLSADAPATSEAELAARTASTTPEKFPGTGAVSNVIRMLSLGSLPRPAAADDLVLATASMPAAADGSPSDFAGSAALAPSSIGVVAVPETDSPTASSPGAAQQQWIAAAQAETAATPAPRDVANVTASQPADLHQQADSHHVPIATPQQPNRRPLSRGPHGGFLVFGYYYPADVPTHVQDIANYSWVCVFAFAGTACREYTGVWSSAMGLNPGGPTGSSADGDLERVLFSDLLSNIVGSLCMGVLVGCAPFLLPRFPAGYAGLTTGFCGCYTTFSSWMAETGAIMARGQVWRALLSLYVGLSLALHACKFGVAFGAELCLWLERWEQHARGPLGDGVEMPAAALPRTSAETAPSAAPSAGPSAAAAPAKPDPPPYPLYNSYKLPVGVIVLSMLFGAFIGAGSYGAAHPDFVVGKVSWGLVMAPFFASIRYTVSKRNKSCPRLPWYTLLCNVVATAISVLCAALEHADFVGATDSSKMLLGALSLGGAGCLSTVSTFVNEVRLLKSADAERYAALTLFAGQLVAVPIWCGFEYSAGYSA